MGAAQKSVRLLSKFIEEEERHYLPSGHLMSLHEMNRAFTEELKRATGKDHVKGGIAAALLRDMNPALHEEMRKLAPGGHRPRGWRTASTAREGATATAVATDEATTEVDA